jgi:hypothetical protein
MKLSIGNWTLIDTEIPDEDACEKVQRHAELQESTQIGTPGFESLFDEHGNLTVQGAATLDEKHTLSDYMRQHRY